MSVAETVATVVAEMALVALRRRHPMALRGSGSTGHGHGGSGSIAPVMQRRMLHVVIHYESVCLLFGLCLRSASAHFACCADVLLVERAAEVAESRKIRRAELVLST